MIKRARLDIRKFVKTSNKGRKFEPDPPSPAEFEAICKACSRKGSAGIRNRALFIVLNRSGLRIGEALGLKMSNLDLKQGIIKGFRRKGGKMGEVGVDPSTIANLQLWMDRRASLGFNKKDVPIFCNLKGKRLASDCIRKALKRAADKAGIDKNIRPHQLRHAFAVELLDEGVNVMDIRDCLGHSNISVTDFYLRGLQKHKRAISIAQNRKSTTLEKMGLGQSAKN